MSSQAENKNSYESKREAVLQQYKDRKITSVQALAKLKELDTKELSVRRKAWKKGRKNK